MRAKEVELRGPDNQLDTEADEEGVWTMQSPLARATRRTGM